MDEGRLDLPQGTLDLFMLRTVALEPQAAGWPRWECRRATTTRRHERMLLAYWP